MIETTDQALEAAIQATESIKKKGFGVSTTMCPIVNEKFKKRAGKYYDVHIIIEKPKGKKVKKPYLQNVFYTKKRKDIEFAPSTDEFARFTIHGVPEIDVYVYYSWMIS